MSFAEKGAVGDIDPAFFIGYLHRVKATGTLKFEDAPIQRAVYFREGRVLFSSSNAPEDQLGAILVAGGKIGQTQFDSIVASLEPKQSIAAALAQGGHVSQRDIGDAARRKVEQIIGACCTQATGQYEFEDGVLPKGALDLKLTTERVLVSAFEVLEPSGFLIRILKSPMAVLAQADVEVSDPDLARLRQALDGVSTIADIGGQVGLPIASTEARAAVLVVLGAATVVTSQIEEMSLPDTGETFPELPAMSLSDDSDPVAAETIGFVPSLSVDDDASKDGPSAPAPGEDSTLVMPPSTFGASADETLVSGTNSGLPGRASSAETESLRAGAPRRATSQDLDAVQELIGAPAPSRPRPGASAMPTQRWEPVLSSAGRPGRNRSGGRSASQNPVIRGLVALVLLGGVGLVAWIGYTGQSRTVVRPPTPKPPAASPQFPAVTPVATAALPPSPASTLMAATPATSPTPATKATPAPPLPTPTPKAAFTPTPAPPLKAAPTVVATPHPAAPPSRPAAAAAAFGEYDAMKAGRLDEAAAGFEARAQAHSAEFSVQLLVACSPQTIDKAIKNDSSPDLFILPATVSGKPCHRMMRGFFKTNEDATRAVSALPGYYIAEGARPKAVPLKTVLK
jgi:hypothetical protein